ncbi:MAG: hypothetical protein JW909_02330 [Planctomycetes bacterium]|nr:hypothetical protein [Planctomycetota bacterium]
MKKVLQTVLGIVLIPVVFVLTSVAFSETGDALSRGSYRLGLNHWVVVGVAAYAVGFIFLEKSSLGGLFRWEGVEALWRKGIGKRAHPGQPEPGEEQPPQPAKPLRMVPYCLPLYALTGIIAVGIIDLVWDLRHYAEILGFVMGFFYAHHLAWIGKDVRSDHPDIKVFGKVLTPVIIYIVNIEIMLLVIALLARRLHWIDVNKETVLESADLLERIWNWIGRTL